MLTAKCCLTPTPVSLFPSMASAEGFREHHVESALAPGPTTDQVGRSPVAELRSRACW